MRTVYISGKTDGCDIDDIFQRLHETGKRLGKKAEVLRVINPANIRDIPDGTWQDYMERNLIYLKHCTAVFMLRGWEDSTEARVEREFAKKLGIEVLYEEERL